MNSASSANFNDHVAHFLGRRVPPALAEGIDFPKLPSDARGVVLRLLALMKRAGCRATDITEQMIWLLGTVTPAMLPSAWGGPIPPLTSPGRHRKLDAYVRGRLRSSADERPVFIDLGCGFPPLTTVDTAEALSDWSVFGVDPAFSRYVLFDAEGRYACFNRHGGYQYCQSPAKPLNDATHELKTRFTALFTELRPLLQATAPGAAARVEKNGCRLIANHIRDFEKPNLSFIKADIEALDLPPSRFVRCMNVLLYFSRDRRERMLSAIANLLEEDGLLVTGFNHPFGIYARYALYWKTGAHLRPCEFAFSLDNLGPLGIGPWLTLADADGEAELLADTTAAIRQDAIFWSDFADRLDELRELYGICRRAEDGFIRFTGETRSASPLALQKKTAALWMQMEAEGYADKAIAALGRAGYTAWKNAVGDIAVLPPESVLPASGGENDSRCR